MYRIKTFGGWLDPPPLGTRSKFWGCQGRRIGVGVTTVSNSLILGGWMTKVLKKGDKNWGGGGGSVGDNNILTFYATGSWFEALLPGQKQNLFCSFYWSKSVLLNFNQRSF